MRGMFLLILFGIMVVSAAQGELLLEAEGVYHPARATVAYTESCHPTVEACSKFLYTTRAVNRYP